MLTEILFYLLGFMIKMSVMILPSWHLWPRVITDAFQYFAGAAARLNFILPVDTFFQCLAFFINFLIIYFSVRLVLMILNFFRGVGKLEA